NSNSKKLDLSDQQARNIRPQDANTTQTKDHNKITNGNAPQQKINSKFTSKEADLEQNSLDTPEEVKKISEQDREIIDEFQKELKKLQKSRRRSN
ncbi:MAG: hypothetical protein HRT88_15785, partial [Lentisphaeraceae bacterium]|nr:hypothetical protein [Lentisphaeraceae bacterium]